MVIKDQYMVLKLLSVLGHQDGSVGWGSWFRLKSWSQGLMSGSGLSREV